MSYTKIKKWGFKIGYFRTTVDLAAESYGVDAVLKVRKDTWGSTNPFFTSFVDIVNDHVEIGEQMIGEMLEQETEICCCGIKGCEGGEK